MIGFLTHLEFFIVFTNDCRKGDGLIPQFAFHPSDIQYNNDNIDRRITFTDTD